MLTGYPGDVGWHPAFSQKHRELRYRTDVDGDRVRTLLSDFDFIIELATPRINVRLQLNCDIPGRNPAFIMCHQSPFHVTYSYVIMVSTIAVTQRYRMR